MVFCFSKRRCDALADSLHSFDMTSGAEKAQVNEAAIAVLSAPSLDECNLRRP